MDDDRARWDRRYQRALDEHADGTGVVTPTEPDILRMLPEVLDHLPAAGRALDIACGTGSVTLWLAARGLAVVALDVSPVAIGVVRGSAVRCGLDDRVDGRVADLDDGLPSDLDDLDLIVCQRFRDPTLYPVMLERLRPSGVACITVLSAVGATDPGPFHAPAGELLDAFTNEGCHVLHRSESDGLASIVVRRN